MISATAAAGRKCECECARLQQFGAPRGDADRADRPADDDDEVPRRRRDSMTGRRGAGPPLALLLLILLGAALRGCDAVLSNLRLCYDKECSVVISKGKTSVPYRPNDPALLSFPANVDVKIFSKEAGSRVDLWGIELKTGKTVKRGYAPKKLIRETLVYHSNLKFEVPVEKLSAEESKNAAQEPEKPIESNSNINSGTAQDNFKQSEVPEVELNKSLEETVDAAQVSPSYDNVYDGTVIPQDIDSTEPSSPRYSTQTLQDNVEKEDVQLDFYPNVSPLSLISGIFGSNKEEPDEEIANVDSSEKLLIEETTEKTPEIEKADESSLSVEEKQDKKSEVKSEDIAEDVSKEVVPETNQNDEKKSDFLTQSEVNQTDTVDKLDSPIEPKVEEGQKLLEESEVSKVQKIPEVPEVHKVPEITEAPKVPEVPEEQKVPEVPEEQKVSVVPEEQKVPEVPEEQKVPEVPEAKKVPEVTKVQKVSELPEAPKSVIPNEITKEETAPESTEQSESQNENVKVNLEAEFDNSVNNPVNIEINSTESLSSVDNSTDKSFNSDIVENAESASDNLQNENVPKKEVDEVPLNTTSIEKETGDLSPPAEQTVLDTSVNSTNIEDAIIQKVPLNQEVKESDVTPKPFIPNEQLPLPNISENESKPSEGHIEISDNLTTSNVFNEESKLVDDSLNLEKQKEVNDNIVDNNNNVIENSYTTVTPTYLHNDSATESSESNFQSTDSSQEHIVDIPSTPSFGEFLGNRNLLNAGKDSEEIGVDQVIIDEGIQTSSPSASEENVSGEIKYEEENVSSEDIPLTSNLEKLVLPPETCDKNYGCADDHGKHHYSTDENAVTNARITADSSETLLYVCITAVTTLLFSLGYYFIENKRRDAYLIGKINNLEKDLMVTRKECIMLDENFKSTKTKLDSIEDESFGSNEMVLSLKDELAASESNRAELEEQIGSLEKELESTSEAGLELERMLREILSSQSEENNPLAQSIEDLQDRLNDQQVANESLKNALAIKTHENETLTGDLTVSIKTVEELQTEVAKLTEELKTQTSTNIHLERTLTDQVQSLEIQIKSITEEKSHIKKQLKMKELEVKELLGVVEQMNINNLDFEKLYEVSHIKAEAAHLLEERDELKIKLSEEEGAHQLLEEHVKLVREEVALLSEQSRIAEKEKKEAETKLEVLTKFFEEKEAQRQKEESLWLEKQGEVSSTVERLHTMQNEILNYKQQLEMLKREIVDQEREYKNTISALETKAHEQWVAARQNERRLEEVKAESSQLRNRLTLVEKNINDVDPEVKLHRLQTANGETPGHPLFPGGETSSSPLMFGAGGAGVPPPLPPPSYMYGPGPFPPPPFLPPPLPTSGASELVGSRPPPLGGGRLSSPPPGGGQSGPQQQSSATSPPMSPPPLPFPPPLHHHHHHHHHPGLRSPPPPLPPFGVDVPPLSLHHLPPPPMSHRHQDDAHNAWGDEALPPLRNPAFHQQRAEQRSRNHKGSLHSSGESLDKSHHGGKV